MRHLDLNSNLILQFILLDLINVNDLSKQLKLVLNKGTQCPLNVIEKHLIHLVGTKHHRVFSWNSNEGALNKLNYHISYFVHRSSPIEEILKPLGNLSSSLWDNGIKCQNTLNGLTNYDSLITEVNKTLKSFNQLIKYTYKILPHFTNDEHFLFFLLQHRYNLEKLFGKNAIVKLFKLSFPKGLSKAKQFMTQKYTKRGFDHLKSMISEKIDALEQKLL